MNLFWYININRLCNGELYFIENSVRIMLNSTTYLWKPLPVR